MNQGRLSTFAFSLYTAILLVFLFAPIAIVVLFSFDAKGLAAFPFEGPTTEWYMSVARDPIMRKAAVNSVFVALSTTICCILIGTSAAFAIARFRFRRASLFAGLMALPLLLPHLLLGISLLSFFTSLGIGLSVWTAIIGHVLITLPFMVFTLTSRIASLDPQIPEAAATLGANPAQAFYRVTLPLIRSAMVGAALLVVAWSLDEFSVSFFTIGSDNTLPIVIWGQMRAGVSPTVNAISAIMVLATILLIYVVHRLSDIRFQ
ncbi:ABC transporter permease [Mesorhizobium sp. M0633]|uniref:ABC transporter permease n=1 Tax=Mesorhizobium sp. M0633 TaxID=2956977 RepID=UPI00333788C6